MRAFNRVKIAFIFNHIGVPRASQNYSHTIRVHGTQTIPLLNPVYIFLHLWSSLKMVENRSISLHSKGSSRTDGTFRTARILEMMIERTEAVGD